MEGVTSVGASLGASNTEPSASNFFIDGFTLVSGTATDGLGQAQLVLPQGTPPDTYSFQAWVEDATHWRSYVSASSPYAGYPTKASFPATPRSWCAPPADAEREPHG